MELELDTLVDEEDFAHKLGEHVVGCRLSLSRFGASRSLTPDQRTVAANTFGANVERLRGNKMLLNKRNQYYRRCATAINLARKTWRAWTAPYPIDGIRLLPKDRVEFMLDRVSKLQSMLELAKKSLDEQRQAIVDMARTEMGELFNEADFPQSLGDKFAIAMDFPPLNPEASLKQISHELYDQERLKAHARFEEALALTHAAMVDEFAGLVDYLIDRLSDDPLTGPKKFTDKKIETLMEFFDRAQSLSIGSSPALDKLIGDAKSLLGGVSPQALRSNALLRGSIVEAMGKLKDELAPLIVDGEERGIVL